MKDGESEEASLKYSHDLRKRDHYLSDNAESCSSEGFRGREECFPLRRWTRKYLLP